MFTLLVILVISVILNLLVPRVAKPLVEMLPGANSNDFLVSAQKMFKFHIDRPIVSSIVVALLVLLSVLLTSLLPM